MRLVCCSEVLVNRQPSDPLKRAFTAAVGLALLTAGAILPIESNRRCGRASPDAVGLARRLHRATGHARTANVSGGMRLMPSANGWLWGCHRAGALGI